MMNTVATEWFGDLPYEETQVIRFPCGLPGFRELATFLPVSQPEAEPMLFLQSVEHAQVCFLLLPLATVDPEMQIEIPKEDRVALELPESTPGIASSDLGIFCILSLGDSESTTANLLAPIVVNIPKGLAAQVIQNLPEDMVRYPLPASFTGAMACS